MKLMSVIGTGASALLLVIVAMSYFGTGAIQESQRSTVTLMWTLTGVAAVLIIGLLQFVRQSLIIPLDKMARVASQVANGEKTSFSIGACCDEFSQVLHSFELIASNQSSNIELAQAIADGKLDDDSTQNIAQDDLGKALSHIRDSVKQVSTQLDFVADASVRGHLEKRADKSGFKGEYVEMVDSVNQISETLVGHLDDVPTPIMIVGTEFDVLYINKIGAQLNGVTQAHMRGNKCYNFFKTSQCQTEECSCRRAMVDKRLSSNNTDAHPNGMDLEIEYTGVPFKDKDGNVIGALEVVLDQTAVVNAQRVAEKQSKYQSIEVDKLSDVLKKIADGDLSVTYEVAEADEDTAEIRGAFSEVGDSLGEALTSLNELLTQVAMAVDQVSSGSQQVSSASQSLSQGANEQASSLEEVSSSITQIGAQSQQNSENATQVGQLSAATSSSAANSQEKMEGMLAAMAEINDSSKEVEKIIKVIDEIAFQTNLLALNAAVEAARAGVHGKGFAVVAEEVRNLAQRSAKAANETTTLIEGSTQKTSRGTTIAEETAGSLNEIVDSISKVNDLVDEITAASREQAQGVGEVQKAMGEIDSVTQNTAANAEESAAASEELSGQAVQLAELLKRFKLTDLVVTNTRSTVAEFNTSAMRKQSNGHPDENGHGGELLPVGEPVEETISLDDGDFGQF
jgi:methyl-accepting chemotaxis protein